MTGYDEHENYLRKVFSNSISSSNPSEEAKKAARKLSPSYFEDYKQQLLRKWDGKKLEDIENSKVISPSYGDTLKITQKEKIDFNLQDNYFKDQINSNLKLLPKIGLKTEQNLKDKGYDTIESLKTHDRYADRANKFCQQIEDLSYGEIIELLDNNRYSKKCRDNIIKSIRISFNIEVIKSESLKRIHSYR